MIRIILEIAACVLCYMVGSNNPLPSVKAKIIAKAKDLVK